VRKGGHIMTSGVVKEEFGAGGRRGAIGFPSTGISLRNDFRERGITEFHLEKTRVEEEGLKPAVDARRNGRWGKESGSPRKGSHPQESLLWGEKEQG